MTIGVRRRMGVAERRAQLIGVALELFSHRSSPDDVSIDEIAMAAGISRPLVYHYFPGKQGLYEAALRQAAAELAERFDEPHEGPLGARLQRVLGRFFDFVDTHGPGFAAPVINEVRQVAYEQILAHLEVEAPPARLELVVRTWMSLVESTALNRPAGPRDGLELQLAHDFAALSAVSAIHDAELADLLVGILKDEPADGPFSVLVGRLVSLLPA
jgi:AcrR family transcriptional regulator